MRNNVFRATAKVVTLALCGGFVYCTLRTSCPRLRAAIRKVDFVTDKQTTLFCRYHKVADGYGLCHVVIVAVEHFE